MTMNDLLQRLDGVRKCGGGFSAKCPAHDDRRQSLSVCERDGRLLVKCHAGCSAESVVSALGLRMSDLFPDERTNVNADRRRVSPSNPAKKTIVCEYVYKNMDNRPVCKKVRYSDKSFVWLHLDERGMWVKGRGGGMNKAHAPAPLYNQFDALTFETVFCVEGEKDVETLRRFNIPAVSLPDGAKTKWQDEYTEWFSCRNVYIIADNDEPGRQCAESTARHIAGVAKSVKIIDLSRVWSNIPEHGDVSDMIAAFPDNAFQMLHWLTDNTEIYSPADFDDPADFDGDIPEKPLSIINLADVETTETQWLWYPYIPRGKITLLTADPGSGKTFFALYLAACVSAGRPFYGTDEPWRERETAVYQTAEDGVSDTIKPRLIPMNPDFRHILMIDETTEGLSLSDDRIERIMQTYKPALIVFDPLQAYLGADVDMHRANEVRPVLAHLSKLAEQYGTAVVLIMHNSKTAQNKALYRALGSIDIPAVARSMLIMGRDPDDENCRVLCHEKSSLAPRGKSLLFKIKPETTGLEFIGKSDLRADDILTSFSEGRHRPAVKQEEAAAMLTELLGEKGWCSYDDVKRLSDEEGVNIATLNKVKKQMGLKTLRIGKGSEHSAFWYTDGINTENLKAELNKSEDSYSCNVPQIQ